MVLSSLASVRRWLITSNTASAPPANASAAQVVTMTIAISLARMENDRNRRMAMVCAARALRISPARAPEEPLRHRRV